MKIQHTNIRQHEDKSYSVEMLLANNPRPEPDEEQIHFVVSVQIKIPGQSPTLGKLQVTALDHVQDVLQQQSEATLSALQKTR